MAARRLTSPVKPPVFQDPSAREPVSSAVHGSSSIRWPMPCIWFTALSAVQPTHGTSALGFIGPELHRLSFSTDLQETDVIFGGEKKLYASLIELIEQYQPKAAFIYSTCIIGIIGDDIDAVCRKVAKETGIPVLPVHSEVQGNQERWLPGSLHFPDETGRYG